MDEQHAAAVQQVVDAGMELFATIGFEATSLRRIAAVTGSSPATLRRHGLDKAAIVERAVAPLLHEIRRITNVISLTTSEHEEVEAVLSAYLQALLDHRRAAHVLLGDSGVQHLPCAERLASEQTRLVERLAGPDAGWPALVRASGALAVLRLAVTDLTEVPAEELMGPLHEVALAAAGHAARTVEGRGAGSISDPVRRVAHPVGSVG